MQMKEAPGQDLNQQSSIRYRHLLIIFMANGMILLSYPRLHAQHDTTYYISYTHQVTTRLFLSQKYTALRFSDKTYTIDYFPNSKINLGLGASYKWATFNVAYGIGYLFPEAGKGKTEALDLQFHKYGERLNFDLVAQWYSGFYLSPSGIAAAPQQYYTRPDLKVRMIGGSLQYVVHYNRFSFRSNYLQNEWQKKSAGSLLLGIETYGGRIEADSSTIPSLINKTAAEFNETSISFFEVGINVGYAYTWVIHEHFFLTGSASVSLDYSDNTLRNTDGSGSRSGVSPNTFVRAVTGYNTKAWAIHLIYVNSGLRLANAIREVTLNTGNFRLSYARRFAIRPSRHPATRSK